MPLNFERVEGELTAEHTVSVESYKVYAAHPAYQFIWHAGLSINSMLIAVSVIKTLPPPTDGYLSLACRSYDTTVRLPALGFVKNVIQDSTGEPPWIQIDFIWPKESGKNEEWALGIRRWMWLTVGAGFVQLFEQQKRRAFKRDKEVALMAKVFRDSCAHGLKVTTKKNGLMDKKTGCAKFGSLTLTKADHDKSLLDFIGLGDFFVLALSMFNGSSSRLPPVGLEKQFEKIG